MQKEDPPVLSEISEKTDSELRDIVDKLYKEEQEISYRRRLLHAKLDILRAELKARLKQKRVQGESLVSAKDLKKLTEILAGEMRDPKGV